MEGKDESSNYSKIKETLERLSEVSLRRLELVIDDPDTTSRELKEITFALLDRSGYGPKSTFGSGNEGGNLASSVAAGAIEGAITALAKLTGTTVDTSQLRRVNTYIETPPSLPLPKEANMPLVSGTRLPNEGAETSTPSKKTSNISGLSQLVERDK
jgi:hypothetical protein